MLLWDWEASIRVREGRSSKKDGKGEEQS